MYCWGTDDYRLKDWDCDYKQCTLTQMLDKQRKRIKVCWIPSIYAIKNKIVKLGTNKETSEKWLIEAVGDVKFRNKQMMQIYACSLENDPKDK